MNVLSTISIALAVLGIFALRVRTRRYIINVAALLLVWQAIALLVGPGVAARNAVDDRRSSPVAQDVKPVEDVAREAMMTNGATTALSLVAWPFLLAAALRRREE
jgi:hypothetical protein